MRATDAQQPSLALVLLVVGFGLGEVRRRVLEEFLLRCLVSKAIALALVGSVYRAIRVHDFVRGKPLRAQIIELAGHGVSRRAEAEQHGARDRGRRHDPLHGDVSC